MKTGRTITAILVLVMAVGMVLTAQVNAKEFDLQKADVHDRMHYHRAIDAAVWAMPLMNFKFYRDALADAGVGPNDVGYFSKIQDWKFQTATPNNTTPYILTYWNIKDGPIVVEIPPSADKVGVFGTLMVPGSVPSMTLVRLAATGAGERRTCWSLPATMARSCQRRSCTSSEPITAGWPFARSSQMRVRRAWQGRQRL